MIAPIRLRDHVPAETLAQLPPDLRALAQVAEWSIDVTVVRGRHPEGAHAEMAVTPNAAVLELQRRASKLSAGLTE